MPAGDPEDLRITVEEVSNCGQVDKICLLVMNGAPVNDLPAGLPKIEVPSLFSSETFRRIALYARTDYSLLYTKTLPLQMGAFGLLRMLQVAEFTVSGMVYSDYYALKGGQLIPNPVIDYQEGSLRDDFNFGSLLLFESAALIETASRLKENFRFAGFYDLRLKLSQKREVFHIPELLYTEVELDTRKSGERLFDYVDPRNREVQIEMEQVCTGHLKDIGAWLKPVFKTIHFDDVMFDTEASVIIPVRNRAKTITDAIQSVLSQRTDFAFNLILVDNHSDDGTSEIISSFCRKDERIFHVIPERKDLGIGGCWNEAIFHPRCGRFAVQLDSDDLYINDTVLSRIIDAFYKQNCAMLVGSYQMVNFRLEAIPPGLIDHREWTPENGRNNALRINGLGAPRAFYTPVIRSFRVPNVSYGEDYALALNISRYYQIGRIYEPLYLCRRWDENSDSSLDVLRMNAHNYYKDKIRTIELWARQQYIQDGQEV